MKCPRDCNGGKVYAGVSGSDSDSTPYYNTPGPARTEKSCWFCVGKGYVPSSFEEVYEKVTWFLGLFSDMAHVHYVTCYSCGKRQLWHVVRKTSAWKEHDSCPKCGSRF